MSEKFIGKMMRLAKQIGEDNNSCYSRKIGTVITNQDAIILSTGYNSPPRKTPNCDSSDYITDILWSKLNQQEKDKLCHVTLTKARENPKHFKRAFDCDVDTLEELIEKKYPLIQNAVGNVLGGCKQCPRKLLGYNSGERSELCSCVHSETNALINKKCDVSGGFLFCWCKNLSCMVCTSNIINAGIKEVHFLDGGEEYHSGCIQLYKYAKIGVYLHDEGKILSGREK